jgi:glutaredoxin-like YruB-family protein
MSSPHVVVYSTPTCPWCYRAKEFLSQRGVPFAEKDVSVDATAAAEMVRRSGQQGVPVITVDDQVVVGFDRPRLEKLLAVAGRRKVAFGAAVADAASYLARRGQVPLFGALVGKVSPGSPAERAGLAPGDIITGLGLRTIANAEGVEQALANVEPGGRLTVTFQRGERTTTREVTF